MVKVMKTEDCGNGCIQHRLVSEHNQPTDVRSTEAIRELLDWRGRLEAKATVNIGDLADRAESELAALLADLAEKAKQIALNEELSMMRHRRTIAADLLWEKAHGDTSVFPDLGELIEWLLAQIAAKDQALGLMLTVFHVRDGEPSDDMYVEKCAMEKARAALSPDAGKGKRVVDVEDINRLFEVIEARHVSNPEIVVIEMLEFARKYIPEHPNAQANTLREKVLADARLRYRVVDVETLERIGGYLMALRMDRPVYDEHGELLGHWQTAATE